MKEATATEMKNFRRYLMNVLANCEREMRTQRIKEGLRKRKQNQN